MTHSILPPELAASSVPWFSRARNYAIFSPEWFRFRSRAMLTGCILVIGFGVVSIGATAGANHKAVAWPLLALHFGIYIAGAMTLVLVGPWLAVRIRRRVWTPRRETAAMLAALLFGMAGSVGVWTGLRSWYEAPSVDLAADELVYRSLPRVIYRLEVDGPSNERMLGLRRIRPNPMPGYDAAYKQYAGAMGLPAPTADARPQLPDSFGAADRATLEAIRQLDAGTLRMQAPERAALEGRYVALLKKLREYNRTVFTSASADPKPSPLTPSQLLAMVRFNESIHRAAVADAARHQALPSPPSPIITNASFVVFAAGLLALLCWLGGLFDLRAFVRQRGKLDDAMTRQALACARDERNTAELKLSVLAAQVEPHFLFNTLASVRAAIASDPGRAAHIVDHMVDYLRATIPQMRGDAASTTVALGAQLAAARSYLALMHERIPRLQFAVEAEPGLKRAAMPPLMLISLVENAVKHGVEPKVGPATVNVRARRHEDALEVSVTDDGVGFGDTSSGAGIGLSNIQERLRTLFGQHASLSLKTCPNGGVTAILRLPLSIEP